MAVCIDEARALIDEQVSFILRSLRNALRKQFARTNKMGILNLSKTRGDFFAILREKTSKVANFSTAPPFDMMPAKNDFGTPDKLLLPLFAIDTFNSFAKDDKKIHSDGSEKATWALFRYPN